MTLEQELQSEQNYLLHAREQLHAMREKLENLDVQAADRVAAAYLEDMLATHIARLTDDGERALIFGRLDVLPDHPAVKGAATTWRIGRRHVRSTEGRALVIDWRAPVSSAFYQASAEEPMHVEMRRRFGFDSGSISSFEDEKLSAGEQLGTSSIWAQEVERPRVGPMRDIVSTIAPDQDELVRIDQGTSLCIQGAPGTGKTAVGLHRAAWLLYTHREQLTKAGVLILGPNRAFLAHIGAVLPTLGEVDVDHATVADYFAVQTATQPKGTDSAELATLKGDERMTTVLDRALWSHLVKPTEPLRIPMGVRTWRIADYELRDIMRDLQGRGLSYDAARALFGERIGTRVVERLNDAGDYPDGSIVQTIAKKAPVKACVKQLWPAVKPTACLHKLLSDEAFLAKCAKGLLTDEEQALLLTSSVAATPGRTRWTRADLPLLDALATSITRPSSLGHVIIDEAQDLSAMDMVAIGKRMTLGSATILGDIAQGTTPWSAASWDDVLRHLGQDDGAIQELTLGFRVPRDIIDFASTLLPHIAPDLTPPTSLRAGGNSLTITETPDTAQAAVEAVVQASSSPGSVGVIVADGHVPTISSALTAAGLTHAVLGGESPDVDASIDVVPASVVKGLEFDTVVVVEPAHIVDGEPDLRTGLRRLYVSLTRAVSTLTVVHSTPLPQQLVP